MPDRESILAMQAGPELDALVAERVMGWELTSDWEIMYNEMGGGSISTETPERYRLWSSGKRKGDWSPSTDVAADYEVLVHVRENWEWSQLKELDGILTSIWEKRALGRTDKLYDLESVMYQTGDYSRAALLTTLESNQENSEVTP